MKKLLRPRGSSLSVKPGGYHADDFHHSQAICGAQQYHSTQRSESWKLLGPDIEVIIFGDEEGTAEVCKELEIRHEPEVKRNESGAKYLNLIFDRAQEIAGHKILCYANCDIMLMPDFREGVEQVAATHNKFLMIGRRWDTDITEPWDFGQSDWDRRLRELALRLGRRKGASWVDYFCFSRDLYRGKMPHFLIGRHGWDPWLIWFARECSAPLVDASKGVVAVHQNHDYAYLKQGAAATLGAAEAKYNWNLGSSWVWHYYSTDAATEQLGEGVLKPNPLACCGPLRRFTVYWVLELWYSFLLATRPIRHPFEPRKNSVLPP